MNQRGYIEGRIDGKSVKKHRLVAEAALGRPLLANEDVHHINGNKTDNSVENLEVIDHASHTRLHNGERKYKRGYKLKLTAAERESRSSRMKLVRQSAIAKATREAA